MDNIINGMRPIHPGENLREEFLYPMKLSVNAEASQQIPLYVLPVILEQVLNSGWACKMITI